MVAFSGKGPLVLGSEEVEILAYQRAVVFVLECGFREIVVEGDNQAIMFALQLKHGLTSRVGHLIQDVLCLLNGFWWSQVKFAKRSAITVAHLLARHAKNESYDIIWMEESPPPIVQALYLDSISIQ